MPDDAVSKRFLLSPGLGEFLDMPATRATIDRVVFAPSSAQCRERGAVYRVSNVFATTMGTATRGHNHHALCGRHLAVGGDTALLMSPHVQLDDVRDNPLVGVALAGRSMSDRSAEAHRQATGDDPRAAWRTWARGHDHAVEVACSSLDRYWGNDLYDAYSDHRRHVSRRGTPGYRPLISPRREIDWDLEAEFSKGRETRHLIVLTAQQELTALYDWLVDWYESALKGTMFIADEGLDDERLALLSIRARGRHFWKRGKTTTDGGTGRPRYDAPVQGLIPDSSLAALYWDFFNVYKRVFTEVVKPKRCAGRLADGTLCGYAVRVVEGPGRPPEFCPRCRAASDNEKDAARHRERRRKCVPGSVPSNTG